MDKDSRMKKKRKKNKKIFQEVMITNRGLVL